VAEDRAIGSIYPADLPQEVVIHRGAVQEVERDSATSGGDGVSSGCRLGGVMKIYGHQSGSIQADNQI